MPHTRTKHNPPVIRSGLIDRPDLLQGIRSDPPAKLTLVAAPAGFGKTTLLVQWRAELLRRGVAISWLSLSVDDGNPIILLRDILDSLRVVCPSFGNRTFRRVNGTADVDVTRILNDLVDDLTDAAQPLALFMDDYHSASNSDTDELVELLLNLAPANFQMIVSSRVRPQLGLAHLRVRGELHEITPAQLRFSLSEANAFFADVRGLQLSSDQVARVHEHSEGWIAGLQLASLALRDPDRRDGFIASFSGRLQDVAEYLASDVLDQQPARIQEFLLRTSVAERINADLSSCLTGAGDARELLGRIEREGLFIMPLDAEHTWYRYHQLFQEFLLGELRRRYPAELAGLYRKASQWFEAEGLAGEAVEYALLAGDIAKVVALVEQQAWLELMAGRMPRVITWIRRIPGEIRSKNPKLLYLLCTALYHSNKVDEAERILSRLVALLDECGDSADNEYLKEQVRLLQSGVAIAHDDLDRILGPLSPEFRHLNEFECGIVSNIRGYALAELGQLDQATRTLGEARRYHELANSEFGVIYSDCFLALTDYTKGNLEHCYIRFRQDDTTGHVSEEKYVAPVPEIIQGVVLYQWNRLDQALERLQPNLPLIAEVGHIKLLALGYMALARISSLGGDHRAAMRLYDFILSLGARVGTPLERLRSLVEADRVAYLLQAGRLNEAIDLALSCEIDVDAPTLALPARWERIPCLRALIWARLQIATGRSERTLPLLARLRKLAQEARHGLRVIEICILAARARLDQDENDASELMEEALELAAPNHPVRRFLDEGKEIRSLLMDLGRKKLDEWSGEKRDFLIAVTRAVGAASTQDDRGFPGGRLRGVIEPISDREREVLELIAAGSTNSVIAATLAISQNTVKWHLKNIFGKLAVGNRTSAVAVARQLDLLD